MTDAPAPATVSLSRPLRSETPRHPAFQQGSAETASDTPGLKALARLVLTRDSRRDTNRDKASRTPRATELPARQSVSASCGSTESETAAETPAVSASPNLTPEQGVIGVSLSQVVGSETPETPRPKPASIETVGLQKGSVEEIAPLVQAWGDAEEERAAIVKHDCGITHAWAEGYARLDPDRPLGDVPPQRWAAFIENVRLFLDGSFCAVAAALGWGPLDLFGCDRDRPFARIDQAGLLWLLNGHRLVALTENTATVETRTGARQTWRRRSSEPGRILAWELAHGEQR
jgi:hypothetical protein